MKSDPRLSDGSQWISLPGDQPRLIARRTLTAITVLLAAPAAESGTAQNWPDADGVLRLHLADFPELAEAGGIARVECGLLPPMVIARIGRSSFTAYCARETGEGLRDVAVRFDSATGVLELALE
jgi:hypothetical protein